ncbi:MAG: hypothetical protein EOO32_02385 [Comamonadaceae bacterium]|nr:MAG: hypothetical protein EOO32_02385 [Comamonadaceae bacterium]
MYGASRSHQQGQALTEFLVIAFALVPLFLLIPILGKYQDIAHATQLASRYAAFDVLVRYGAVEGSNNPVKETSQLQNEVRRRFFSNSDAPIKTDDTAGDFKAHQNPFWRTPDDQPLIRDFADVTVERTTQFTHDGNSAGSKAGPFNPAFGATGIRSAAVSVKLGNLPSGLTFYEPFDKIDLVISRGTSVLADGWTGRNPDDVITRFEGLVPAVQLLPPLSMVVDPVVVLVEPGVPAPHLGKLDFWRDDVHPDRLKRP